MKPIILFFFIAPIISQAQSLDRAIIGAAGNNNQALSWTIGEPVTKTIDGTYTLTQGFHQCDISVYLINKEDEFDYHVSVYPNPVKTLLTIESDKIGITYKLVNINGKVLKTGKIISKTMKISFSEIPTGTYILDLNKRKTHIIIKQ